MPIQLTHSDLNSTPQKLSKIETLRLARNYIIAMSQTLQEDKPMEMTRFIKILSKELSQTTENLLSGAFLNNTSNYPYNKSFHPNDYEVPSYENSNQSYNIAQYMYGENYGQLWNYKRPNYNYDHLKIYSSNKNCSNTTSYWDYNNNTISNHYPYGNYQYASWQ